MAAGVQKRRSQGSCLTWKTARCGCKGQIALRTQCLQHCKSLSAPSSATLNKQNAAGSRCIQEVHTLLCHPTPQASSTSHLSSALGHSCLTRPPSSFPKHPKSLLLRYCRLRALAGSFPRPQSSLRPFPTAQIEQGDTSPADTHETLRVVTEGKLHHVR